MSAPHAGRAPDPKPTDRPEANRPQVRSSAARALVWLTGGSAVLTGLLGGLDAWSCSCAALAVVLLSASTALLHHWPDGPAAFLVVVVLLGSVAPHPSAGQSAALVVAVASYLYVVDAVQSGRDGPHAMFGRGPLRPLAIGTAIGVPLTMISFLPIAASSWWTAAAGVIAAGAGTGVLLLVDRSQRQSQMADDMLRENLQWAGSIRTEGIQMAKSGRKRRARRKKNANHGKRPNA